MVEVLYSIFLNKNSLICTNDGMYQMNHDAFKDILKDKINNKGYVFLRVHGNSMFPTIRDNDLVCVSKTQNISVGDVIGYFLDNGDHLDIVIHRVVLVRKTYVLTKGDNNDFIDPVRISMSSILGVISDYEV